jgi:hypothetical protein
MAHYKSESPMKPPAYRLLRHPSGEAGLRLGSFALKLTKATYHSVIPR